MKKYILLLFLSLSLMFLLSACSASLPTNNVDQVNQNADIILYYSDTCPHCQAVEKYLTENKIADFVKFARKEVGKNKDNAAEFLDKAGKCNLDPQTIGVPFLWDGSKCFMGQDEIINFFNIKKNEK